MHGDLLATVRELVRSQKKQLLAAQNAALSAELEYACDKSRRPFHAANNTAHKVRDPD